jgi:hypothetical protein
MNIIKCNSGHIEISPIAYEIEASFDQATLYCWQLVIDSRKGWRLPTRSELFLMNENYQLQNVGTYWSSDPMMALWMDAPSLTEYQCVTINGYDSVHDATKHISSINKIRPVRNSK